MKRSPIVVMKQHQLVDIYELRIKMARLLCEITPNALLSIGDGTVWRATWIGHSVEAGCYPESIGLAAVIDIEVKSGSVFERQELWSGNSISPVLGNGTLLPFATGAFDLVVSSLMIDDCFEHRSLLLEMYRCTRAAGVFMIAGHGLDITEDLRGVEGLLGSRHRYPCTPMFVDIIADNLQAIRLVDWISTHTWLKVYRK